MRKPYSTFFMLVAVACLFGVTLSCQSGVDPDADQATGGAGDGKNKGFDGGATGAAAKDYLVGTTYKRVVVEIQAMEGFEPTESAKTKLKEFLEARLNKPSGVVFVNTAIKAAGNASYTLDDVKAIEDANRRYFTEGDRIVAYILFLDGASSSDSGSAKVLGHAYRNTSTAIYEKSIRDLSGIPPIAPEKASLETVVMQHELGHLLGLVNNGSDLQTAHQDSAHGKHCSNTQCLMYYQADTNDLVPFLQLVPTPSLDEDCLRDLRANGGK